MSRITNTPSHILYFSNSHGSIQNDAKHYYTTYRTYFTCSVTCNKVSPSLPPFKVQASYCYCMFKKHCITLDKKKRMILVEKWCIRELWIAVSVNI
jgi:hypothetical protein